MLQTHARPSRLVTLPLLMLILGALTACTAPTTRRAAPDNALVQAEREKQREIAVAYNVRQYVRLQRVAYPLLKAATPLCQDTQRPGFGYLLISRNDFAADMRPAATRVFDIKDGLRIHEVYPGGPAERAGLRAGDELISVDGFRVAQRDDEEQRLNEFLRKGSPSVARQFSVLRDGKPLSMRVQPDVLCRYGVGLSGADDVNAMADGDNVIITKGMMRFAETDQELSLVVAHEIAHNTMNHIDAKRTNATGGLLLDVLAAAAGVNTQGLFQNIGASAYSQDFESEADYVGMYIMARAGLPLRGAADFWRRMAAEHPSSIASNHSASHPASAERFVSLEHTVKEIEQKQTRRLDLLPELQPKP